MSDLETRLRRALRDETSDLGASATMADDLVAHGSHVRRRRRAAVGVAGVAVVALLVPLWRAVDNDSGSLQPVSPRPPTTTVPSNPPARTNSATPPSNRAPAWTPLPVDVRHTPMPAAEVLGLRVGRHTSFDRIVIDFKGAISGYRVQQVPALVHDGSGGPPGCQAPTRSSCG